MSNENVEILNLSVIITQDDYLFKVIFDPKNEEESIDLEFKVEESNQREEEEEEDRFIIEFNLVENQLEDKKNDSNKN
jgi:hypothetical protein